MKRRFLKIPALILALLMLLSSFAFAGEIDYGAALDEAVGLYRSNSLFGNPDTDYIRDALIETFEEDPDFFYDFMNKIYEKNDRYSHYMAPKAYEVAYGNTNTMVGIGVTVTSLENEEYLTITSVIMGAPAQKAGIMAGDRLVAVDGMSVKGFLPAEAGLAIRGVSGTTVNVTVLRGEETLSFNVKRDTVALSHVSSSITEDKVGYIKLKYFDGINTFIDFLEAYRSFKDAEVNTVVLDLRDNPGGDMGCFISIIDNVIPKKDVPYLMTWQANPMQLKIFQTEGYGWDFNKFVILINENTASAAELMAGTMQDLGYAVVVGKTSFGKGMGQRHIQTSTGDEAVITVLDLKLPVSGSYDGIGIKPDFDVDMKITPYRLPHLTPLKKNSVASKIKPANVRAIEERLSLLGYFFLTPDDEWDTHTVFAINMFCRDNNLSKVTSVCKWETIAAIDDATRALEEKYLIEDTQLDRAMQIAKEYAKSDKKAECIDINLIDFRR